MNKDQTSGPNEDADKTFWREYAFQALAKLNALERSSSQTAGLMLLIALAFELINRREVHEVNLGLVKLSDVSFLLITMPVILSYLFSTIAEIMAEANQAIRAYQYSLRRAGPEDMSRTEEVANWWYERLLPSSAVLTAFLTQPFGRPRVPWTIRLREGGGLAKFGLTFFGPLIFEVYAYVQLYIHHSLIAATISLAVSTLLISYGFAAFLTPARYPIPGLPA